jgi:hypothetical protein
MGADMWSPDGIDTAWTMSTTVTFAACVIHVPSTSPRSSHGVHVHAFTPRSMATYQCLRYHSVRQYRMTDLRPRWQESERCC